MFYTSRLFYSNPFLTLSSTHRIMKITIHNIRHKDNDINAYDEKLMTDCRAKVINVVEALTFSRYRQLLKEPFAKKVMQKFGKILNLGRGL